MLADWTRVHCSWTALLIMIALAGCGSREEQGEAVNPPLATGTPNDSIPATPNTTNPSDVPKTESGASSPDSPPPEFPSTDIPTGTEGSVSEPEPVAEEAEEIAPESPAQPSGTIAPDTATARRAETALEQIKIDFRTTTTLDALSHGLVGDGITDNTDAFKRLLSSGDRTILIPEGDYVTGRISIPAKTELVLSPGVVIRDSGRRTPSEPFILILSNDVRIIGHGARVVAKRSDYTTGEHRHGIIVYGAQRVLIDGLESSSHGGDGFYIGGPKGQPSTDVVLKGCAAADNRRQGLSITSARRVLVVDCEFEHTRGTDPQFGIDLEPNNAADFMDQITIVRPLTRNNHGGGILFWLRNLDETSFPIDIAVLNHRSEGDAVRTWTDIPQNIKGVVRYGNIELAR